MQNINQNKNWLMILIVIIYIAGLFASLSGNIIAVSAGILTAISFLFLKDYISFKKAIILTVIFYLGIINTTLRLKNDDELKSLCPINAEISGEIVSVPIVEAKNKVKFFMNSDKITYDGITRNLKKEKVLVNIESKDNFKIFDSYKIKGRLTRPKEAGNPSQFDYGNYLQNYDTYTVLYGKNQIERENITVCYEKINKNIEPLKRFVQKIGEYREFAMNTHSKYINSPNLEILGGIVYGNDAVTPPKEIKQSFANSGLMHILAASGMNVAFIFSFFFFFLNFLKIPYRLNICLCISAILVYVLMTGMGPSIVRAGLMLGVVLLGKLIDREAHSLALLAFVAFIMLLFNPMNINDIGFQLSFIVTFGLLLTVNKLAFFKNRILNWIAGTISIPVIAQLWVLPLQIFYFNNISLYSVFANIMSVPILSVISFGGFISSLLCAIKPLANVICMSFDFILNPLLTLLVNISDFWGQLPNSTIQTSHPSILQIIFYYLLLINISLLLNNEIKDRVIKLSKITIPAFISLILLFGISIPNHHLEITAFDVGNSDAFLIKTPSNDYMLIDTGKSGYNSEISPADTIILKYLKDNNIKNIDTLILTHFDNDHCGGAVTLIKNLNIKQIYINNSQNKSDSAKLILKTAYENGCRIIQASNNETFYDKDNLKIKNFISDYKESDDNEASIMTYFSYGDFSALFSGDAGVKTYIKLKEFMPKNITILKVGHHGADGVINKQIAEYFNPKISLISTGANTYGHPSQYTIETLKNSKILRTDTYNSIKFVIDKKSCKTYHYDSKKRKYILL